jgi:ABC-type multidrug transport system ATPase subunit
LIKGISGGERKRTSIAVDMITLPSLIMLDEPTSGLDSFTAYLIMNILKNYSRQGNTVIYTIHQPSYDIF